jgi:hypothetical protein
MTGNIMFRKAEADWITVIPKSGKKTMEPIAVSWEIRAPFTLHRKFLYPKRTCFSIMFDGSNSIIEVMKI